MVLRIRLPSAKKLLIAFSAIVLLAASGVLYAKFFNKELPERVDLGSLETTISLRKTLDELHDSLSAPLQRNSSAQITHAYTALMEDIANTCGQYNTYAAMAERTDPQSDNAVYLRKSTKLCAELTPLAKESGSLYATLTPVMELSPKMKQYQKLFLRSQTKQKHLNTVTEAQSALRNATNNTPYQSNILSRLQALQMGIKTSDGLSYSSALQSFQASMLTERQRYWTNYAEIDNLLAVLKVQTSRYCQVVPASDRKAYASDCDL